MKTIVIDPDGTQEFGLIVLIEYSSGTRYEVQCGGHMAERRNREGYIVPVGAAEAARPLQELFARLFRGNPPPAGGNQWTPDNINELEALVARVAYWTRLPDGIDSRHVLTLDLDRAMDLTEAWVPVITPDGKGALIFKNSD
jgi:hypothetical protein